MTSIVTVRAYSTYLEAAIARSFLEAHGFLAVIPDWYHASNAWHLTTALQGVRVIIIADEAGDAHELLGDITPDRPSRRWPPLSELLFAAAVFLLTGIPHPIRRD